MTSFVPSCLSAFVPLLGWLLFALVIAAVATSCCWLAGETRSQDITCDCGHKIARRVKVEDAAERAYVARRLTDLCPLCRTDRSRDRYGAGAQYRDRDGAPPVPSSLEDSPC
jgi:hypothetical protein